MTICTTHEISLVDEPLNIMIVSPPEGLDPQMGPDYDIRISGGEASVWEQ